MEGQQMAETPVEAPVVGRRCYVGNLAWAVSWQDLKDCFRECGEVVRSAFWQSWPPGPASSLASPS